MKKKRLKNFWSLKIRWCLLALTSISILNAQNLKATPITINMESVPLEKILIEIQRQGDCDLIYKIADISKYTNIAANFVNLTAEQALIKCLANTDLNYEKQGARSFSIYQQTPSKTKIITGTVTDINGNPIIGVTVAVKGTKYGTITSKEGSFRLEIDIDNPILNITSVGYKPLSINVGNKTRIDIKLEENVLDINEVLVIGYGTTTVKDATGAVGNIGEAELSSVASSSTVQSALQGFVSGVNVNIGSSAPDAPVSIMIRGISTLTGDGQPLWVIDGVPDYSAGTDGSVANLLNSMNINDIQNVSILKDASAAAIYGSRGANGVIIVTTKKGRVQKPCIDFFYNMSVRKIDNNRFGVMTAEQWKKVILDGCKEWVMTTGSFDATCRLFLDENYFKSFNTSHITKDMLIPLDDAFGSADMDWWNYMMRTSIDQKFDLAVSGGTGQTKYRVSLAYQSLNGNIRNSYSDTFSGRININTNINKYLTFGLNVNGSSRKTNNKDNLISQIITFRPDNAPYKESGEINDFADDATMSWYENPLISLSNKSNGYGKSASGSAFLEFAILPYLKFKTTENFTYNYYEKDDFYRKGSYGVNAGRRDVSYNETNTNVWENLFTYNKLYGAKHAVTAILGMSMESYNRKFVSVTASGFPDDDRYTSLSNATNIGKPVETYTENALQSLFARANYTYDNKYLVTATFRSDGSSKFGQNKKWGYFPSAAIGWVISEEKFFEPLKRNINFLKLRASAGESGSQNLKDYEWRALMSGAQFEGQPAYTPSASYGSTATQIGNYDLGWEKCRQRDVALETAFFDQRLRVTFGWYEKKVSNMLYGNSLPPSMGYSTMTRNVADIMNRGLELDISAVLLRTENQSLTFNFNISGNRSKVLNIDGSIKEVFDSTGAFSVQSIRLVEGGPLGEFYGLRSAGRLYYSMEEIYGLRKQLINTNGTYSTIRTNYERPGDAYFLNLNGEGNIDGDDREVLGNFYPKAYGGFNLQYRWKALSVSANFSYSIGNMKYWYYLSRMQSVQFGSFWGKQNAFSMFTDNASSNGPTATYPRVPNTLGNNQWFSDAYLFDASYLRLTNITLSYRLPGSFLKRNSFISGVEFTGSVSNIFTLTKYPGMDPQGNFEVASKNMFGLGKDMCYYPPASEFRFGIKLLFK